MNDSPTAAVHHENLRRFATDIMESAGVPKKDAGLVADTLVQADLWGHQSHGVMRLAWYAARLRSGAMDASSKYRLALDSGAIAVFDGCDGIGQVTAFAAATEAVRRAKRFGIGTVAVRNSNHFGTAMYFTKSAADNGCVAFLSTNASPAMAPWGGRTKSVGNNPWSWAAPAGRHSTLVLDIANTTVARGKIYLARQKGLAIPLGWAIDADGVATTDPASAIAGNLMPMAGHKGYGISVVMDMLSGVLSGSGFGGQVAGPYQSEKRGRVGHLMIALNIEAFQPLQQFNQRVEALIDELKSGDLAKGSSEILYPGELEARNDVANRKCGVRLPTATLLELERLADEYKCQAPSVDLSTE